MIAYHGPYSSRLGRASILGQDAAVQPVSAPPPVVPDPQPFGSGAPGGPTPPPQGPQVAPAVPPTPVTVVPASNGWVVNIAGHQVQGWTLVMSGLVVVGGIALVVYTKEDLDLMYSAGKKGAKK